MRLFSIVAVLLINLFIAVRYTVLIRRGEIKPALAMWIFFSIAVGGSLTTYLFDGDYSLLDNILNSSDLLLCVYVAVIIYVYGDVSTRFNRFDRGCLVAVLIILAFWIGLYPKPFFDRMEPTVNRVMERVSVAMPEAELGLGADLTDNHAEEPTSKHEE